MLTANVQSSASNSNSASLQPNQEFQTLTRDSHREWPVVFFLLDFTFVCPASIAELGQGGAQ
jgi:alkyl hydroperoxide reductase subunit AhpC